MKYLKLLFTIIVTSAIVSSCSITEDEFSLEELLSSYDLWYVDYHRTIGSGGEVPFLSKAFTISFLNGNLYANNNIVDIGRTGNGLGIVVGNYDTYNGFLETVHDIDGRNDFEVSQISSNEIKIYNRYLNVTYYLIGYQTNNFDYDKLFYENIEYFLQEYIAWSKETLTGGVPNPFDDENHLSFTPENNTTFYSSKDNFGTDIDNIIWDFIGDYQIYDVNNYEDLKILTLNYEGGSVEEFELTIVNDQKIRLYHISSETTYVFLGKGFIQYLKDEKASKFSVRKHNRKRTKIKREKKNRRNLK